MLRIGFICANPPRDWQVRQLYRALADVAQPVLIHPSTLRIVCGGKKASLSIRSGDFEATRLDAALIGRVVSDDANADLAIDAVRALELAGVPLVNRVDAMLAAQDKLHTAALLATAGIQTPECSSIPSDASVDVACDEIPQGIAKPLFGSLGDGLFRVRDKRGRGRLRKVALEGPHLLQRQIEPSGVDFRLFVVGDRVEGCMRREARSPEWRSNVGRGARALPAVARPSWRTLAIEATRALGLEVAGVDIALDGGQPTILEINGFPRFSGLWKATGKNMAPAIARRVRTLARQRTPGRRLTKEG